MSSAEGEAGALSSAVDIGLALRQRREQNNIALDDVARELRLTPRQLSALENGQFSEFRSAVFVKGYLRTCAKMYGMDGDVLVRAYECVAPKVEEKAPLPVRAKVVVISRPHSYRLYWIALVVFVLALAVAGVYWKQSLLALLETEQAEDPTAVASVEMATSGTEAATVAEEIAQPVMTASVEQQTPVQMTPLTIVPLAGNASMSVAAPMSSETAITDIKNTADDQQDSALHIEFSDDCWVQIKSHDGKVVHEKNYRKGEVLDLSVSPPLYVWLGRAAAANVNYNGTMVPVPIKTGAQSARFVLGNDAQADRIE